VAAAAAIKDLGCGLLFPILEASVPDVEVLEVLSSADVDAWWLRLDLNPTSGL
jgi:hypothetical protein